MRSKRLRSPSWDNQVDFNPVEKRRKVAVKTKEIKTKSGLGRRSDQTTGKKIQTRNGAGPKQSVGKKTVGRKTVGNKNFTTSRGRKTVPGYDSRNFRGDRGNQGGRRSEEREDSWNRGKRSRRKTENSRRNRAKPRDNYGRSSLKHHVTKHLTTGRGKRGRDRTDSDRRRQTTYRPRSNRFRRSRSSSGSRRWHRRSRSSSSRRRVRNNGYGDTRKKTRKDTESRSYSRYPDVVMLTDFSSTSSTVARSVYSISSKSSQSRGGRGKERVRSMAMKSIQDGSDSEGKSRPKQEDGSELEHRSDTSVKKAKQEYKKSEEDWNPPTPIKKEDRWKMKPPENASDEEQSFPEKKTIAQFMESEKKAETPKFIAERMDESSSEEIGVNPRPISPLSVDAKTASNEHADEVMSPTLTESPPSTSSHHEILVAQGWKTVDDARPKKSHRKRSPSYDASPPPKINPRSELRLVDEQDTRISNLDKEPQDWKMSQESYSHPISPPIDAPTGDASSFQSGHEWQPPTPNFPEFQSQPIPRNWTVVPTPQTFAVNEYTPQTMQASYTPPNYNSQHKKPTSPQNHTHTQSPSIEDTYSSEVSELASPSPLKGPHSQFTLYRNHHGPQTALPEKLEWPSGMYLIDRDLKSNIVRIFDECVSQDILLLVMKVIGKPKVLALCLFHRKSTDNVQIFFMDIKGSHMSPIEGEFKVNPSQIFKSTSTCKTPIYSSYKELFEELHQEIVKDLVSHSNSVFNTMFAPSIQSGMVPERNDSNLQGRKTPRGHSDQDFSSEIEEEENAFYSPEVEKEHPKETFSPDVQETQNDTDHNSFDKAEVKAEDITDKKPKAVSPSNQLPDVSRVKSPAPILKSSSDVGVPKEGGINLAFGKIRPKIEPPVISREQIKQDVLTSIPSPSKPLPTFVRKEIGRGRLRPPKISRRIGLPSLRRTEAIPPPLKLVIPTTKKKRQDETETPLLASTPLSSPFTIINQEQKREEEIRQKEEQEKQKQNLNAEMEQGEEETKKVEENEDDSQSQEQIGHSESEYATNRQNHDLEEEARLREASRNAAMASHGFAQRRSQPTTFLLNEVKRREELKKQQQIKSTKRRTNKQPSRETQSIESASRVKHKKREYKSITEEDLRRFFHEPSNDEKLVAELLWQQIRTTMEPHETKMPWSLFDKVRLRIVTRFGELWLKKRQQSAIKPMKFVTKYEAHVKDLCLKYVLAIETKTFI